MPNLAYVRTLSCRAHVLPATLITTLALLVASAAHAENASIPVAGVSFKVNGVPIAAQATGTANPFGSFNYAMSSKDAKGAWSASMSVLGDADPTLPEGGAMLTGMFEFCNTSPADIDVEFVFDLPLCPLAVGACSIGGSTTVKVTLDDGGGKLSCPAGDALWSAMLDGNVADSLFYGPFQMSGTGKGTPMTYATFGVPIPGKNFNGGAGAFGLRHRFVITPGEKVKFTNLFSVAATPQNLVACGSGDEMKGDLNDDKSIDAIDLGLLLTKWGTTDAEADLNEDGGVDGYDLGEMLAIWS
jgi:hypothetical protein